MKTHWRGQLLERIQDVITWEGVFKAHIPPETAFVLTSKREEKVHKQYEMYMPNAKTQRQGPNATYIPQEMGFAFATQREEIYTKKMKCT